jgi:2'-5' RNA ligase
VNLPVPGPDETLVGLVVTVPEPYARVLVAAREASGDAEALAIAPHVTLVGPVPLPDSAKEPVYEHVAEVASRHDPFELRLRGTATFRPVSPVAFVQVSEGIADCEQLERALRAGPMDVPVRFPYHPHVTVAQDVDDDALDGVQDRLVGFDARFRVSSVDLYVNDVDGVWRCRRSFPLGASVRPAR